MNTPPKAPAPSDPTAAGLPRRPRSAVVRVLAVMAAAWIACIAWALSSPPGSGPDELPHVQAAWAARTGQNLSGPTIEVPTDIADASACLARWRPAVNATSSTCRVALTEDSPTAQVANGTALYPPVFHRFLSIFLGPDLIRSVYVMRVWVSLVAVLLLGVPMLLMSRARLDVLPVAVATAVAMGPLAWFFLGSINPSSWELAGAVCAWGSGVALVLSRHRADRVLSCAGIVLGLGIGALSRPEGGAVAAFGLLLAAPMWLSTRGPRGPQRRRYWAKVGIGYLVLGAVGVLAVARGALDLSWGPSYTMYPINLALVIRNLVGSPDYVLQALGPVGWLDTPTGSWATLAFVGAGGYLVLTAFVQGRRVLSACLAAVLLAALGTSAVILTSSHLRVGDAFQARYLWPLTVGVVFVGCLGLAMAGKLAGLLGGHVRLVLVSGFTVGTTAAMWLNIQQYAKATVVPPHGSSWSPALLGTTGTLLVGAVALTAFYTLTLAPWRPGAPVSGPTPGSGG